VIRFFFALALFASISGSLSAQTVGPKGDRYELRVAKTKAKVYSAALAVLTDSSFMLQESSLDGGLIRTGWRSPHDVQGKGIGGFFRAGLLKPIRLTLVIIPVGTDSTRVTITGEIKDYGKLKKESGMALYWDPLQNVGDAILAALK
jgi:hypothetical protein